MKRTITTLVTILFSAFSLCAADPAGPTAEKATLTASELQDALRISAWRVQIPASLGDKPFVLFEHYVKGERTVILDSGIVLVPDGSREFLVTLREDGANYRHSLRWDTGLTRGAYPTLPEKMGPFDFARSSNKPESTPDAIVLMRVSYYKKEGGINSNTPEKLIGEVVLRIAKEKSPHTVKGDADEDK